MKKSSARSLRGSIAGAGTKRRAIKLLGSDPNKPSPQVIEVLKTLRTRHGNDFLHCRRKILLKHPELRRDPKGLADRIIAHFAKIERG